MTYDPTHPFAYCQGRYKTELKYWWKLFGAKGSEEIPPDFDTEGWLAGTVKRPGNPKGASE